jgi:hypothetical protein
MPLIHSTFACQAKNSPSPTLLQAERVTDTKPPHPPLGDIGDLKLVTTTPEEKNWQRRSEIENKRVFARLLVVPAYSRSGGIILLSSLTSELSLSFS